MEEVDALVRVLEKPERPTAAVIGGAKVSSKIDVLTHLVAKVDRLIIGGAMANTFLLAEGVEIGKSLAEPDHTKTALEIMHAAKERHCEVILPRDVVVAAKLEAGAQCAVVPTLEAPADKMILDVGPKTVAHYAEIIGRCRTLLWNGPLGAFEVAPFGEGTFALAREAAALTKAGRLVSVAGGGDTVAALNAAGVTEQFTYVSTAGGAFLEWLEGRESAGHCRADQSDFLRLLDQLHPELASHRASRACQSGERHGFVLGVEQAFQLRAARLHALCQRRLGQSLLAHERVELTRDHALDGARGHLLVDALLPQPVVVRGADAALLPFHVNSFMRLVARSRSFLGVLCVFLAKPCRRTIWLA